MTKEQIIKNWIPNNLIISEGDDKKDPLFIPVYNRRYPDYCDFDEKFVVNAQYMFNMKTRKLKESEFTTKFPFHACVDVEDFVTNITDTAFGSISDNCYSCTNDKKRIVLKTTKILDKKDLTLYTSYTDIITARLSAPLEENEEVKPFEECEISFTLVRVFSSIPEDFINIRCSEAYDKMVKIKKEMKDNLYESLVYKFVKDEKLVKKETNEHTEEGCKEHIEFVDCMLISLRDMYKNLVKWNKYTV